MVSTEISSCIESSSTLKLKEVGMFHHHYLNNSIVNIEFCLWSAFDLSHTTGREIPAAPDSRTVSII
jgi:hypothetical protein